MLPKLIVSILLLVSLKISSTEIVIEVDRKYMSKDLPLLPDVPSAFKKNSIEKLGLEVVLSKIKANFSEDKTSLNLYRSTEPKDISLFAKKKMFSLGYLLNDRDHIYAMSSKQLAMAQSFNCYEFSSITLGFCDTADFEISSSNSKYDSLGNNVIKISGSTENFGLGYHKSYDDFWFESVSLEYIKTSYSYDWISPLEDIKSPFLLNLTFDGVLLGDALDDALTRLPQREKWQSSQLNLKLKQKFIFIYDFNLITEYELVLLNFSDYREYKDTPEFNFRIRAGIEYYLGNINLLFYGDAYVNNLIGFEPITFNQRTEHYFDKPYGELGLKFVLKF